MKVVSLDCQGSRVLVHCLVKLDKWACKQAETLALSLNNVVLLVYRGRKLKQGLQVREQTSLAA